MSKNVIYIKETREFIVDGNTIKEDSLSEAEATELKEKAIRQHLLTGQNEDCEEQVIV